MIVALDNTFLTLLLNEKSEPRPDPATGRPATYWRERIEGMIDAHSKSADTILIPAPCLAEALTVVPDIGRAISLISSSQVMQIVPFDAKCAIELGLLTGAAIKAGDKKGGVQAGWQEVKFDRQIAVIAKTFGAAILYTDDQTQTTFAVQSGLKVKHSWDLPVPQDQAQPSFLDIQWQPPNS